MYSSPVLPWTKIHEFLLKVGSVREPKELCVQAIQRIHSLVPYDQARIYFLNEYGEICDEFLIGVEQRWSDVYLAYYSKIENGLYSIPSRWDAGRSSISRLAGGVRDWTEYECNEFIADYIQPQGLKHSAGFAFHGADDSLRSIYALDRTSRSGYTSVEIDIMTRVQPHLDNLHRNLFVLPAKSTPYNRNLTVQERLTKRESEIGGLLCKGLTPSKISRRLSISLPTVYRHIANIHKKLNVSNRQELLLRLMNQNALQEPASTEFRLILRS